MAIPTSSISQMWVGAGRKSHFWQGAGLGLLGGALIGGLIGSTTEFCIFSCEPATGIGVVLGAPAGFLVGGVIGAAVRTDRWRATTIAPGPIRIGPSPDARGVMVSIAF